MLVTIGGMESAAVLEQNLEIARDSKPLSAVEVQIRGIDAVGRQQPVFPLRRNCPCDDLLSPPIGSPHVRRPY